MVGAFFVNGEICAFLCPFLRKEVSAVANRIMGITEGTKKVIMTIALVAAALGPVLIVV